MLRHSSSSLTFSAMISLAPFRASATPKALASTFIFWSCSLNAFPVMSLFAVDSMSLSRWSIMAAASGSNPISLAACALVRRLGLKGRYRSSRMFASQQFSIFPFISSVNFPWASMVAMMVSLRLAISFSFPYLTFISVTCSSVKPPVRSFLYLAMNGMVHPSSSNWIVLAMRADGSCSSFAMMSVNIFIVHA